MASPGETVINKLVTEVSLVNAQEATAAAQAYDKALDGVSVSSDKVTKAQLSASRGMSGQAGLFGGIAQAVTDLAAKLGGAGGLGSGLGGVASSLARFAPLAMTAAGALVTLGAAALSAGKYFADFQQQVKLSEVGVRGLTDSSGQADRLIAISKEAAHGTQLLGQDLHQAALEAEAFGRNTQQVVQGLTNIVSASGRSREDMQQMLAALTSVGRQSTITAGEAQRLARQFGEFGPVLAQAFGTTPQGLLRLPPQLEISTARLNDLIEAAGNAKNVTPGVLNLTDSLTSLAISASKLTGLTSLWETFWGNLTKWANDAAKAVDEYVAKQAGIKPPPTGGGAAPRASFGTPWDTIDKSKFPDYFGARDEKGFLLGPLDKIANATSATAANTREIADKPDRGGPSSSSSGGPTGGGTGGVGISGDETFLYGGGGRDVSSVMRDALAVAKAKADSDKLAQTSAAAVAEKMVKGIEGGNALGQSGQKEAHSDAQGIQRAVHDSGQRIITDLGMVYKAPFPMDLVMKMVWDAQDRGFKNGIAATNAKVFGGEVGKPIGSFGFNPAGRTGGGPFTGSLIVGRAQSRAAQEMQQIALGQAIAGATDEELLSLGGGAGSATKALDTLADAAAKTTTETLDLGNLGAPIKEKIDSLRGLQETALGRTYRPDPYAEKNPDFFYSGERIFKESQDKVYEGLQVQITKLEGLQTTLAQLVNQGEAFPSAIVNAMIAAGFGDIAQQIATAFRSAPGAPASATPAPTSVQTPSFTGAAATPTATKSTGLSFNSLAF